MLCCYRDGQGFITLFIRLITEVIYGGGPLKALNLQSLNNNITL